jgi:hypothetical protein
MHTKHYKYPQPINNAKLSVTFGFVLLLLLLVLAVLGYIPENYDNVSERYLLIAGLLLGLFGCVYFLGWWADIEVDEDGLLVHFLWMKLRVLWGDIVDVKPFGPKFFHLWVVITKNKKLTFFHRLYGLYSLKSLKPSFFVCNMRKSHQFLISQILKRIKQ